MVEHAKTGTAFRCTALLLAFSLRSAEQVVGFALSLANCEVATNPTE
jgi:hypothetical protein